MLGLSEPALKPALEAFLWSTEHDLVLDMLCFRLYTVICIYRAMTVTSIERGEGAIVAMVMTRKKE